MIQHEQPVKGAVVYWTARRTDLTALKAAWDDLGFGRLLPDRRSGVQLLRDALMAEFPNNGKARLVRRAKDGNTLTVVYEDRQPGGNVYAAVQSATYHAADGRVEADPPNPAVAERYDELSTVFPGGAVGHALIKAVRKLDGVALRPTGGVYWLPPDGLEQFRKLAEAAEAAGGTTVYLLQTQFDDRAAVAVRDGLEAEVRAAVADILDRLAAGDLGKKGIEGRRAKARVLLAKVRRYEELLGTILTDVREAVGEVEVAAAAAELALAAEEATA